MLVPGGEAPLLAQVVGGHITGHPAGFNGKSARAAEGVEQGTAFRSNGRPAGTHQQGGGEVLLQRGLHRGVAVAAPVQGIAGEIERERGALIAQVQMHADVGVDGIHIRPLAAHGTEAVGNRILHLQRGVVGVGDGLGAAGHFDGEGVAHVKHIRPVVRMGGGIEGVVAAADVEGGDGQQHARGHARPQAGLVGQFQRAAGIDAADGFFCADSAECLDLVQQQRLHTFGAGEKKLLKGRGLVAGLKVGVVGAGFAHAPLSGITAR